ncbi:hypothetical protein F444_16210 [Phytophthora nicotianae P1976]|nr:hypothetical protein F444_16210 [Phytophthora nicotianae P1976]
MYRLLRILEQFDPERASNTLSSDVIGCVVPRGRIVRGYVYAGVNKEIPPPSSATHSCHGLGPESRKTLPSSAKRSIAQYSPKPQRKNQTKSPAEYREQRRLKQERYRRKQTQREHDLAKVVKRLRQEVPLLQMQHMRMVFGVKLMLEAVVTEYFQLFRHGIWFSNMDTPCHLKAKAQQQLVFLRTAMSNDVILGGLKGVDALVEQWRRYCTYFDNVELNLGVVDIRSNIAWANATLSVTVTKTTLDQVFPHLLEGEQYKLILRSRLLGQRLVLPCRICFEWDEKSKRVVRLDKMLDFFTPLQHLLPCFDFVATVMEKALITLECIISDGGSD